jgi:hypothetical protein
MVAMLKNGQMEHGIPVKGQVMVENLLAVKRLRH